MKKLWTLLFLFPFILIACSPSPEYMKEDLSSGKKVVRIYLNSGDYAMALREIKSLIKEYPHDAELYNLAGIIYLEKREYRNAKQCFFKAIELNHNYSEAWNNLGSVYMFEGNYTAAIKCFKKALENPFYPKSYIPRTNLAWAYYQLGQKEKAINLLIETLRQNFQYPEALIKLGLIYLKNNKLELAKFYLKRAVKSNPSSAEARYYLGEVFLKEGKYELAEKVWNSVTVLFPQSEWASLAAEKVFLVRKILKGN